MIDLETVSRDYSGRRAVDSVSFRVEPGEVVGFLGANGAGKSTVLRMLSTYLEPSAGRLAVAGVDVVERPLQARAAVGYLTEHNALFEGMRVAAFLAFMGRMRGLAGAGLDQRLAELAEHLDLRDVWNDRIRTCSKGYRQRIGLAAALVHDPPVLLLDEPTHGLDPLQVDALRRYLHSLREGRAILFSSHVLAEVVEIAERVLLLHHGRLVLDAPVTELRARAEERGVDLEELVLDHLRGEVSGE